MFSLGYKEKSTNDRRLITSNVTNTTITNNNNLVTKCALYLCFSQWAVGGQTWIYKAVDEAFERFKVQREVRAEREIGWRASSAYSQSHSPLLAPFFPSQPHGNATAVRDDKKGSPWSSTCQGVWWMVYYIAAPPFSPRYCFYWHCWSFFLVFVVWDFG